MDCTNTFTRAIAAAAAAALLATTTLPATAAPCGAAGIASRYDAAHVDYEIGHYAEAYAAFAQLADAGHPGAARIALQMRRFGPTLYGADFAASAEQVERWVRLATPSAVAAAGGSCALASNAP
jgi:hypothetical protein